MHELIRRLSGLQHIGNYIAPSDARITPIQIPEHTEIVELITGGEVFFEVEGVLKAFGRGTIFWHEAGDYTVYRTTPEKPYRCAVFKFAVKTRNNPAPRVSFWNTASSIDQFVSECLNLFHSQTLDMNFQCLYTYSTLLRHAMVHLVLPAKQNFPTTLNRALDYIQNHTDQKITIENLAENSEISQPQLFKLFQTHLDITPHKYISSQQLLKAKTMLAGTQLPVKAISAKCGFVNLEVFYRRFKADTGISPGKYRQKHMPYKFSSNTNE